jgi:hypothetical protein
LQILNNSAAVDIFTFTYTPTLDLDYPDSYIFFYNIDILPDLIILELKALAKKAEYIVEKLGSAKV